MKYKCDYKITKEMYKFSEITDEYIFRRMATNMVEKIPISELIKLFNLKKIDPESEISNWKLMQFNTPVSEKEFILSLKRSQTILFEGEINL